MNSRALIIVIVLVCLALGMGSYFGLDHGWERVVPQEKVGIANPASAHCAEIGGRLEIVADSSGGQAGFCHLKDGRVCEEWALFRDGKCVSS